MIDMQFFPLYCENLSRNNWLEFEEAFLWDKLFETAPDLATLTAEDIRSLEDKVQRIVDDWSEIERATAYLYMHSCGLDLQKAHDIRRKAGLMK